MPIIKHEIVPYRRSLAFRTNSLLNHSDDERRRLLLEALESHDVLTLYAWLEAHEVSASGGEVSRHTLRNLLYSLNTFFEFVKYTKTDVIRPPRRMGSRYKLYLTSDWHQIKEGRTPLAPSTIGSRISAIRLFYFMLRQWTQVIDASPFDNVRGPKDPTNPWDKRQPYPQNDLNKMLEIAYPEERAVILLGAHGGLRAQEMIDLALADIDFDALTLIVARGKGGKMRKIQMSPALSNTLRELTPTNGMIFSFSHPESLARRIHRLCQAAGVKYRAIHSLRHSCGTRLMDETDNLLLTAKHLGHKQIETTRIYAKWSNKKLKLMMKEW